MADADDDGSRIEAAEAGVHAEALEVEDTAPRPGMPRQAPHSHVDAVDAVQSPAVGPSDPLDRPHVVTDTSDTGVGVGDHGDGHVVGGHVVGGHSVDRDSVGGHVVGGHVGDGHDVDGLSNDGHGIDGHSGAVSVGAHDSHDSHGQAAHGAHGDDPNAGVLVGTPPTPAWVMTAAGIALLTIVVCVVLGVLLADQVG